MINIFVDFVEINNYIFIILYFFIYLWSRRWLICHWFNFFLNKSFDLSFCRGSVSSSSWSSLWWSWFFVFSKRILLVLIVSKELINVYLHSIWIINIFANRIFKLKISIIIMIWTPILNGISPSDPKYNDLPITKNKQKEYSRAQIIINIWSSRACFCYIFFLTKINKVSNYKTNNNHTIKHDSLTNFDLSKFFFDLFNFISRCEILST